MEFCDQSWNFTPEFYQICTLFADLEKFSISLDSLHFATFFSRKMSQIQNLGREVDMENREKVMDKSFAKSVGTLMSFIKP